MNSSIILFVFILLFNNSFAEQQSNCGDWEPYKDEKCYKVMGNNYLKSFDDAMHTCYQLQESTLMSIQSQEEQDFLFNLLNNVYNIVNNVWLGIEFRVDSYKWIDSRALNYTNWANGNPINESGYDCVQLVLTQPYNGQWVKRPCNQRSVVVCEKMPIWNYSYLVKRMIEMRDVISSITTQLEVTQLKLENTTIQLQSTRVELENTNTQLESTNSYLETTKTELQNEIVKATPAGTIAYFARSSPPFGWLKANGQVVSRTTYSNLFASIGTTFGSGNGQTTFQLPDLRGEFIRGWSDGRNVDTNRAYASFQWGSSIPLAGYLSNTFDSAVSAAYQDRWTFSGQTFDNGFEKNVPSGQTRDGLTFPNDNYDNGMNFCLPNNFGLISTWNVMKGTRPRNIALLACIMI